MSLTQLVRVFGRIGLLSFGGPAAQIALMHKELVEDRGWLSDAQFLRALSFCMLLPGPEAMQLATYAGWRLRGTLGGLIAGLLFVLPGAVVMAALALAYSAYGQVPLVQSLFVGVKACVVVIVIGALIKVSQKALKSRAHSALAVASFLALFMLNAPFPLVIAAAALIGAVLMQGTVEPDTDVVATRRGAAAATARTVALWLVLWLAPVALLEIFAPNILVDMAIFFSTLAVVSFGGAYAVLAYMTQIVVGEFGWLNTAQMVDALGLAETTPGPLILVTQFVAMIARDSVAGSLAAGAVTLWVTFAPCFLWIFAGAPYIDRLAQMPRLSGALAAITAAVVGVIANLGLWFAGAVFFEQGFVQFAPLGIAAIAALLMLWRKWDMLWVLPISAALGLLSTPPL